ncbi:MAG: iron-containing alcohol dehydrogenase [Elusimicrobiota bacterium]|jgi:alcohol dehydrogenase class IV|nr:iron-containing alcohol dehydrogenase [Elusimicrobiota bacterium]
MAKAFDFVCNRQVLFGEGKIKELAGLISWHGVKKVFFAAYKGIGKDYDDAVQSLSEKGIGAYKYEIATEPDLNIINNGRDIFLKEKCDCTVALGGGSVIDTAKSINMLAANGGNVEQYQMEGKQAAKAPTLFVAIPTTAGTGAEATKTAVVTNNNNGLKKSLYHTSMIADIVILDPVLTLGLPPKTTAATGMDALSHAIESYVSLNANTFSEMFGLKAIEIINENLPKAFREPSNIDARGSMLLASYLGGQAITAGIGIAHIMAQPIGALYHVPHGDACSIFLPASMELNMPYAAKKYAKIAFALGVGKIGASDEENTKNAIKRVQDIQKEINAPSKLAPYIAATGKEADNAVMIDCIKRTTGHITCNPKPLNEALMTDIFNMCK